MKYLAYKIYEHLRRLKERKTTLHLVGRFRQSNFTLIRLKRSRKRWNNQLNNKLTRIKVQKKFVINFCNTTKQVLGSHIFLQVLKNIVFSGRNFYKILLADSLKDSNALIQELLYVQLSRLLRAFALVVIFKKKTEGLF